MVPEETEIAVPAPAHKVADIGRYRLIAELARGGMGIVYLALVRGPGGFNKLFVVKVLKEHLAEDPKLVFMFLEEARLAAKLNHPNVVQTIEVGSDGGRHFIAMEFLDGQSLHRTLARGRRTSTPMPLNYQLSVLVPMLEGLQYAHGASDFDGAPLNLVHRDVSPQNVFLTYDGQVKILDFGIAKALDSSQETRTGVLKGKISYMAPEQASGEPIDRRADVFAAGVMLWEVLAGKRMWDRSLNDLQILHALVHGNIPRLREHAPEVDERLERLVFKALSLRKEERYASASEMQIDIEQCMREIGLPIVGPRDLGKFVADLFAEERAEIKNVVDGQLRALKRATSGEYAGIDMPQLSPLTTASGGTPSMQSIPRVPRSVDPAAGATSVPVDVPIPSPVPPPAPARASSGAVIAVALAVVAVAALAGAFLFFGGKKSDAPRPAEATALPTASAPTTVTAAAGPPPTETASAASATPPAATAAATPTGEAAPGSTPSPRQGGARVRRGGWIAHPAQPTPPASAAAAPPAPATPPPQPAATATTTSHVRQQIDTSNPYGH